MRNKKEFDSVIELKEEGKNNSEISRITKIPRGTVKDWINNPPKHFTGNISKSSLKDEVINNKELHPIYSYLLGLYLGDGYINKCERTFRMRIALDKKYIKLNEYAVDNMKKLFIENKVGIVNYENYINISVYNSQIPNLFPQHGKGVKHSRDVSLKKWQKDISISEELIKGLIHSDGCFYKETIKNKYIYERYVFSNKSEDLHEIFQNLCEELDIDFDFQNKGDGSSNTRIAKKESVEKLKNIIGTKEMLL